LGIDGRRNWEFWCNKLEKVSLSVRLEEEVSILIELSLGERSFMWGWRRTGAF
jgi:hypothetical protein